MSSVKVIATIGPACSNPELITSLIENGATCFRLNGAHASLRWHEQMIKLIRSMDPSIPILFDIPGSKVRIINILESKTITKGDRVLFSGDEAVNDVNLIKVSYPSLHNDLRQGDTFFAVDGTMRFEVELIERSCVTAIAHDYGLLQKGKGLNFPTMRIQKPQISQNDHALLRFAVEQNVDFVGISFVENAEHIRSVKSLLGTSSIGIIAKIEKQAALECLDEILTESAGVMLDRGDMVAENRMETIGLVQKCMVQSARRHGKPAIIATEMLHSMVNRQNPRKAEILDITNAVLDGASALMLSDETAIGDSPVESVRVMASIAREVESALGSPAVLSIETAEGGISDIIASSIRNLCFSDSITKVICVTFSGFAPRLISRYCLSQDIIAVTHSVTKARQLNLLRGVHAFVFSWSFAPERIEHILDAVRKLWESNIITVSDRILITAALFPSNGTTMNYLSIHDVSDLVALWRNR